MEGLSHDAEASRHVFSVGAKTDDGHTLLPRVEYLLNDREWFRDSEFPGKPSENGPGPHALGLALEHAATDDVSDPRAPVIAEAVVHSFGERDSHHGDSVPSSMTRSVANILGTYIGDMNHAIDADRAGSRPGDLGATFDRTDLLHTLAMVGTDKDSNRTVSMAELRWTTAQYELAFGGPAPAEGTKYDSATKYADLSGTVLGTLDFGLSDAEKSRILAGDTEHNSQVDDVRKVVGILAHDAVDIGKEGVPAPKLVVDGGSFLLDKAIDELAGGFTGDHSAQANARVAAVLDDREAMTSQLAVAAAYEGGMLPGLDRFRQPDGTLKPMDEFSEADWIAWNGTDLNGNTVVDQANQSYAVKHRNDYDAAATFGDHARQSYLDGYTAAVFKLGAGST
jgi:hypothetical protein